MNWLDAVLVLILIASIVASFRKGLAREVLGLVSIFLALLLGFWLYGIVGAHLLPYLSSRALANFFGFVLVFCGVAVLGSLVSLVVGKFLRVTGLSIFDHALGAAFGMVRGILISVALVMGIMAFTEGERPPASVVQSRFAPYVVDAARVIVALAPHEVREGFHRTYAQVKTAWEKRVHNESRTGPYGEKTENERQI